MGLHLETEIKLRITKPAQIKRRIKSLGFRRITLRLLERNTLFDFPDSRLSREHFALRLRTAGGESLLTFKGPPRTSNKHKVREEIEIAVDHPKRLREILRHLGLREVFSYSKRRTAYAHPGQPAKGKHALLLFDETPAGIFLELEGPARWIDQTAQKLGYSSKDYITRSYPSLYRRRRKRRTPPYRACQPT